MDILDKGTHVFPLSTSYCIPLHTPMAYVIYLEVHFAGRGCHYWHLFEQKGCVEGAKGRVEVGRSVELCFQASV
jgi:hypothetical protein